MAKLSVKHNGLNVSTLYLNDVGRKYGLGGGVNIHQHGQDCYISPGETKVLELTSDVHMSMTVGTLKRFSSGNFAGVLTLTVLP